MCTVRWFDSSIVFRKVCAVWSACPYFRCNSYKWYGRNVIWIKFEMPLFLWHWIFTKSHNETLFSTFFLIFIIPFFFVFCSLFFLPQHADVHATACWRIGSYAPAYIACWWRKYSNLFTQEYHIPWGQRLRGIWYSWGNKFSYFLNPLAINVLLNRMKPRKHIHVKYYWQTYFKSIDTLSQTFKNHIHNNKEIQDQYPRENKVLLP